MNRTLVSVATAGLVCGAALVAPTASADVGDPTRSQQVVDDAPRATIVVTSTDRVAVQLRIRYHSYFQVGGDGSWTPNGEVPHVSFVGASAQFHTPDGRTIALQGPSVDGESDDEPRVAPGTDRADDQWILTGRFRTTVDPLTIGYGQGSLTHTAYRATEEDGPDLTWYSDKAAGEVPVDVKYASTSTIVAPATADPGGFTVSGRVRRFSPVDNATVPVPAGRVSLQRAAGTGWDEVATDSFDGGAYSFTGVRQSGSAVYRVVYAGSPMIDGSGSGQLTVLPAGTVVHRPSAPRAPRTTVGGPHRVSLHWRASATDGGAAILGYQVQRGTAVSTRRNVAAGARSAVFRSLTTHRRYAFVVRARNQVGWSPWARAFARPHR